MNLATVSPTELGDLVKEMVPRRLPILVKGKPGIGKTSIIRQTMESIGYELLIAHPVVDDPTDYKGFPFVVDGKADFIPFGNLRRLMEATKPLVFFLDDLGQAAPSVQAACMQLLLARSINGVKISDKVSFVAATNGREHRAGVSGILEPVKSRFVTIVQLETNLDDWVRWALTHNMPPELIAFIRFRPDFLDAFSATSDLTNSPTPRTIANVGKLMNANVPAYIEKAAFAGAAGQAFAVEFSGYLDIYRSLPDIDELIRRPLKTAISNDTAVLFAITTAVSYRANKQNMGQVMKVFDLLPREYQIFGMTDVINRDPKLKKTKEYQLWIMNNSDILL